MLTENYRTLTPAYGRDYKNKAEVLAAFNAENDFFLQPEGCYINKQQIASGVTVNIRFKGMRNITVIKVK
jgi:hypothetical protein